VFQAVLPMQEELNMFAEYKEKLAGIVGGKAAARILAESLFLVCAGTDDIANNYYLAPVRPLQYDIMAYVDFLVQQASSFMKVNEYLFPKIHVQILVFTLFLNCCRLWFLKLRLTS
jgi:hypothetical protein